MLLRDLLLEDYDDCECTVEKFDSFESARAVILDGPKPRMLGPLWVPGPPVIDDPKTMLIPLRAEPVLDADIERAFALAGSLASNTSLGSRDLKAVARLVPVGWHGRPGDVPDMTVAGLGWPVMVSEPEFLGQWIHNRVNHGLMILLHGLAQA